MLRAHRQTLRMRTDYASTGCSFWMFFGLMRIPKLGGRPHAFQVPSTCFGDLAFVCCPDRSHIQVGSANHAAPITTPMSPLDCMGVIWELYRRLSSCQLPAMSDVGG